MFDYRLVIHIIDVPVALHAVRYDDRCSEVFLVFRPHSDGVPLIVPFKPAVFHISLRSDERYLLLMSRQVIFPALFFIESPLSRYCTRFLEISVGDMQDVLIEWLVSSQKNLNKGLLLIVAFPTAV